jgi:hypothetical protein
VENGQTEESRSSIVQCPECSSYNAEAIDRNLHKLRCRCTDCGTVYSVRARKIPSNQGNRSAEEDDEEADFAATNHKIKADRRAQIAPAAFPDPAQLGHTTILVDKALAAGPAGLRKAQRVALKFARQFQQEAEDHFKKRTDFLNRWFDSNDPNARAGARYALVWRPKFLAGLSLTNSPTLAAQFARTTKQTVYNHRKWDSEFAQQWQEAIENAVDLLHARAFQRALEGDCEPVFYMGVPVAYVRKFDSRLQIELLRAYRPDRFKTPGGASVNVGTRGDVFVLTEEQRHELIRINREYLTTTPIPTDDPPSHSVTSQPPQLTNGDAPPEPTDGVGAV